MLRRLRSYLRQHHLALLALFIALGGTSYAAIKLPANSVGSSQIKNKAVTPKKVSPAAVKLFRGKKGAKGATGATGPTGPTGLRGPAGGTAWAFAASNRAGAETPIGGSDTTVLSLVADGGAGITTSFASGLIATATITIRETTAGTVAPPTATCHLEFQGTPATSSVNQKVTFPNSLDDFKQVTLTGLAARPAGTYDVLVKCSGAGTGALGYSTGSLTVHAAAG